MAEHLALDVEVGEAVAGYRDTWLRQGAVGTGHAVILVLGWEEPVYSGVAAHVAGAVLLQAGAG